MSAIIASYCKCLIEASSFGIFCDVTLGMSLHIHLYCNRCLELRLNSNLFIFSWRSCWRPRSGVRQPRRSFSRWVSGSVASLPSPATTSATTTATLMPSWCLLSISSLLCWPPWWCLPCWASKPISWTANVLQCEYKTLNTNSNESIGPLVSDNTFSYFSLWMWYFWRLFKDDWCLAFWPPFKSLENLTISNFFLFF